QALIEEQEGGVHDPMDSRMMLLDLSIGPLQRQAITSIGRDIERGRSQSGEPVQFRLDGFVFGSTIDPDDASPVRAQHVFAPDLADATSSTDDDVDAAGTVAGVVCLRQVNGKQPLPVPGAGAPVAPDPGIAARIRGYNEPFGSGRHGWA